MTIVMSFIPRGKLIGMKVYNPDGVLVGTVQDVALPLGGGELAIQVVTKNRSIETIEWNKIEAIGDIIILREKIELKEGEGAPIPPEPAKGRSGLRKLFKLEEKPRCPICGRKLSYIKEYGRWYCRHCKKYV